VPDASGSTAASLSIALEPASAPVGVGHFQDLVKAGFYEGCPVFRAIPGFVAQFGISPDPGLNKK
jgi:cyclophilin family peptidyl-prolyl cis-trans isomerase